MQERHSPRKVADLFVEAISDSRTEYDESHETSISDAPEYFLTVNCVKKISTLYDFLFATMEWNVKDALLDILEKKNGGKNKSGHPVKDIRENDVDLWGFAEIKKDIRKKAGYDSDIKRIRGVFKRANRYDYKLRGFFAFYIQREDDEIGSIKVDKKIDEYIADMHANIRNTIGGEARIELHRG